MKDVLDLTEAPAKRPFAPKKESGGMKDVLNISPEPPPSVSGSEPLSMSPVVDAGVKGFTGGPLNMLLNMGMKSVDQLLERGAYTGGGAVTDLASQAGAYPEVSAGLGTAANFGIRAIPTAAGYLSGKVAELVGKPAGRAVMQSAMKPGSKDIDSGDAAKAITTMLEGGYNVTPGGVAKMRKFTKYLGEQVDDLIRSSNGKVTEQDAWKEIYGQLGKFREQVNPDDDIAKIMKSWNEHLRNHSGDLPVEWAQRLKQGTYKILADKYASMGQVEDEAATQAQMAIARGLRKGIEREVPGVVPLNQKQSELINAIELAERRAGVAGNRDLAGIAWLSQYPAATTAMLADRSPLLKSLLARYLYSGMPTTGAVLGTGYGIASEDMDERVKGLKGILSR